MGSYLALASLTSLLYWPQDDQPSTPLKLPSPGYSTRYTPAKISVIQNRLTHQLGRGLFSSTRSPSHLCPISSAFCPGARRWVLCEYRKMATPSRLTTVMIEMYQLQKSLVNSSIPFIVCLL